MSIFAHRDAMYGDRNKRFSADSFPGPESRGVEGGVVCGWGTH
jgi:hypothetical protein